MSTELHESPEAVIHHPNFDIPRAGRDTTIRFVKSFPVWYWTVLAEHCEVEKTMPMLHAMRRICEGLSVREIADELDVNHSNVMAWAKAFRDADMRKVSKMVSTDTPQQQKVSSFSSRLRTDIPLGEIEDIRDEAVNPEIRRRCEGILALAAGVDPGEVAQTMGVGRAALYQWRDRFNAGGKDWLLRRKPSLDEAAIGAVSHNVIRTDFPARRPVPVAANDGPRATVSQEDRILLARRIERAVRSHSPLTVAAVKNWLRLECDVEMRNAEVAKTIMALGFFINASHVQLDKPSRSLELGRSDIEDAAEFEDDVEVSFEDDVDVAFEEAA